MIHGIDRAVLGAAKAAGIETREIRTLDPLTITVKEQEAWNELEYDLGFSVVGETATFWAKGADGEEEAVVAYLRHGDNICLREYRLEFFIRPHSNTPELLLWKDGAYHSAFPLPSRLEYHLAPIMGTLLAEQFTRILRAKRSDRVELRNGDTTAPGCGACAHFWSDREPYTVERIERGGAIVVVKRARAIVAPGTGGYGAEKYTFQADPGAPEERAIWNNKRRKYLIGGVKQGTPITFRGYGAFRDPHF